jgi:AbrB family looped-hinge helix DNA binding protein
MKITYHKRKIDRSGRLVLPIEIRRSFDLLPGNEFDFFIENNFIIIKKREQTENVKTIEPKREQQLQ